jgi:hypothetical protein
MVVKTTQLTKELFFENFSFKIFESEEFSRTFWDFRQSSGLELSEVFKGLEASEIRLASQKIKINLFFT